ncbi:formate dehydrogenase accessory protein FdhE [Spirochaetota bacterium]
MKKTEKERYSSLITQTAQLKKTNPELKDILEFYGEVLAFQQKAYAAFHPGAASIDIKACLKRNSEGMAFLLPDDIDINNDIFKDILNNISDLFKSRQKEVLLADIEQFTPGICSALLSDLMNDRSGLEKTARDMEVDFSMFYFLILSAFSPFVESYADELRDNIDLESWDKGTCPLCGGEPLMARLDKESGKKWLYCSLCRTEWIFRRIVCPFCGNEEHETIKYFYTDKNEAYRVDVCDACKRYTKTIDARKIFQVRDLFIENLASLAYDIVAEKDGFQAANYSLIKTRG